jgi:uncharacterized protein (TIGR02217 family)
MSNAVFPIALPGLSVTSPIVAPRFNTKAQGAVSGRETRAAFMQYPLWDITVGYEFLRTSVVLPELNTLVGFFGARKGSWDSFLILLPEDNACTDMAFATGDGVTRVFQLTRSRGAGGFAFSEPVMNVLALTNIKAAGSVVSGATYSIGSTGLVTFITAPANGALLTWTGSYYFRCRFLQDTVEFARFMSNLWDAKKVQMVGAPGNRV